VELRELIQVLAADHETETLSPAAKQHSAPMASLREAKMDRIMDAYAVRTLFDTLAAEPGSADAPGPASPGSPRRRLGSAMSVSDEIAHAIPSGATEMLLRDMFDIQLDGPLALVPASEPYSPNREHNRNRYLRLADIEDLLLTAR
jgi:hypothetical protein